MAKVSLERNKAKKPAEADDAGEGAPSLLQGVQERLKRNEVVGKILSLDPRSLYSEQSLYASILAAATPAGVQRTEIFELAYSTLNRDPAAMQAIRDDIAFSSENCALPGGDVSTLLYSRGIRVLLGYRVAHVLWTHGMTDLSMSVKILFSQMFGSDIHPAAFLGGGVWLEHAMGLTVGASAVIEERVAIWQGVTLGPSPKDDAKGRIYPTLRKGVKVGASAILLGGIEIGANSMIAPGSVVLESVGPNMLVSGIPAKAIPVPKL